MSNTFRRRHEVQEPPFGPGPITDWVQVGEAAMAISPPGHWTDALGTNLLTTADVTQVDAVIGDKRSVMLGNPSTGLYTTFVNNGAPTYQDVNLWSSGGHWRSKAIFTVNDTAQVAGYVGVNGYGSDGSYGLAGNFPGDTLFVKNSGPFLTDSNPPDYDRPNWPPNWLGWYNTPPTSGSSGVLPTMLQDQYVWDGSKWVLISHYVGPYGVTSGWWASNQGYPDYWELLQPSRQTPDKTGMYAMMWTHPGRFADGMKFRCTLKMNLDDAPGGGRPYGISTPGIVMNMTDKDNGLMWVPWGHCTDGSGWTKKPSDLKGFGSHYFPERVQADGSYTFPGGHPLTGTFYADLAVGISPSGAEFMDIHGGGWQAGARYYQDHPGPSGYVVIEVWRKDNKAYAAFYADPGDTTPAFTSTFAEDLTGGPYADGAQGYFGIAFDWLNADCGVANVELVPV